MKKYKTPVKASKLIANVHGVPMDTQCKTGVVEQKVWAATISAAV